jgi:hypothetical protein
MPDAPRPTEEEAMLVSTRLLSTGNRRRLGWTVEAGLRCYQGGSNATADKLMPILLVAAWVGAADNGQAQTVYPPGSQQNLFVVCYRDLSFVSANSLWVLTRGDTANRGATRSTTILRRDVSECLRGEALEKDGRDVTGLYASVALIVSRCSVCMTATGQEVEVALLAAVIKAPVESGGRCIDQRSCR